MCSPPPGSMTNTWMCQRSSSGFLVVLDGKTGGIAADIPLGDAWPARAVFLNDGKNLLYATNEYRVALWDLSIGEPGLVFLEQTSQRENDYPDVAAAPDGKSVAAVVQDTLYVWDMTGELLFQAPADKGRIDAGLAYSVDGSRLAVYAPDNAGVDIYETAGWTL